MNSIKGNLERLHRRIEEAASRAGRDPAEIDVVAVTKGVSVERINEAIRAGIRVIGENRVQEAREKYEKIGNKVSWHFIGHLQRNKTKKAVEIFDLIHSADRLEILEEINKFATKCGKIQRVLLEVNISGEDTKFGFFPEEVFNVVPELGNFHNVQIEGLMGIGPYGKDLEAIRRSFRLLRKIFERMRENGTEMKYLSMGMSDDFEIAVEEGANLLRIGRAIFGERE
jgi:hypothetical protein